MAIDYGVAYPAQTDTDAAYPQGKAKNVSVPGAGDGTPWTADVVNDIWGFLQALIKSVGATPSGSPDTANVSQYLQSLARATWGAMMASNWTYPDPGSGSDHLYAAAYSESTTRWVLAGAAGKVYMSVDLGVWFTTTLAGTPTIRAACWSESLALFIICGDAGYIATSPDGITWTSRNSTVGDDLSALAVKPGSPDTVVAVGDSGVNVHSTTGTTWAAGTSALSTHFVGVAYSPTLNLFVRCGSGVYETSADGATWSGLIASPSPMSQYAIAWSTYHAKFVAVGLSGWVETSVDGLTWESEGQVTGTPDLYGVAVDSVLGQAFAVGEDGVAVSFDLSTWAHREVLDGVIYRGAAYSAVRGQVVTAGDGQRVGASLRLKV
jgi:hypothetical protein